MLKSARGTLTCQRAKALAYDSVMGKILLSFQSELITTTEVVVYSSDSFLAFANRPNRLWIDWPEHGGTNREQKYFGSKELSCINLATFEFF